MSVSLTVQYLGELNEQLPGWRARLEEERRFLLDQGVILNAEREAFPTLGNSQEVVDLRIVITFALAEVDDALTGWTTEPEAPQV